MVREAEQLERLLSEPELSEVDILDGGVATLVGVMILGGSACRHRRIDTLMATAHEATLMHATTVTVVTDHWCYRGARKWWVGNNLEQFLEFNSANQISYQRVNTQAELL